MAIHCSKIVLIFFKCYHVLEWPLVILTLYNDNLMYLVISYSVPEKKFNLFYQKFFSRHFLKPLGNFYFLPATHTIDCGWFD